MNIIPVAEIPKKRSPKSGEFVDYKPTRSYLKEFMKTRTKCAKVSFTSFDYANTNSAYCTLRKSIKDTALPIAVVIRDGDIYLVRTDMEE